MKKRVLSLFLAFVLSFSMMPMSAFAEEAGTVTEQETQNSENTADVSATGEETTGEDTAEDSPTVEDISGGNAVTKDAEVEAAQARINALPEEVTAENADALQAQLMAIDEALAALTEEQRASLNMARLENICVALTTFVAAQDGGHADHPVCGDANCKDHGETLTGWTAIADGTTLLSTTSAGYYYLTNDVTLDATWKPVDNTVLCLNGHSITVNAAVEAITVPAGSSFTLTDCNSSSGVHYFKNDTTKKRWVPCEESDSDRFSVEGGVITHSVDNNARGVTVQGTFIMYGGTICGHSNTVTGAGVAVDSNGKFGMYGGAIKGNTANSGIAGGVYVYGGTFTMNGGMISDNTADNGSGVYVNQKGTFTMTGGTISSNTATKGSGVYMGNNAIFNLSGTASIRDNTATFAGGGAYLASGTFNMTGGTFSNNTANQNGGGVYVDPDASITVAGEVKIDSNTDKNKNSNNVYLDKSDAISAIITVTDELAEDASIGVTTNSTPTENSTVTFAAAGVDYNLTADDAARFSSDAGYTVSLKNNTIIFANGEPHEHAICGAENCSDNHTSEQWKPITSLADINGGGYYYLKNNVKVSPTWECNYDVKLCLNGKTITGTGGKDVIIVAANASLDITDCKSDNGKITLPAGAIGRGIYVSGGAAFTLWNGDITGITPPAKDKATGSGVYVAYNGQFTMRGGAITGNTSGNLGGGVYVAGTFIMSGGEITGNTSTSHGGGVYVSSYSTFTMTGGKIIGNNTTTTNTDGYSAGGVYVDPTGSFIVSGNAQIRNNYWNGTLDANKVYVDGKNSNVLLLGSDSRLATITIGENGLKPEAKIGVGRNADSFDKSTNKAKIATGANDPSLNYATIFTSDDPQYVITNDQGTLYLGVHQHNWSYTQSAEDEKTINATCTAIGCPNSKGGSVTIKAPDENTLTYDGSKKTATLENNLLTGESAPTISYTLGSGQGGMLPENSYPTNAGTYTASITVGGVTASVAYEIRKADPVAKNFVFNALSNLTYDGEPKEVTVEKAQGINGMGNVTVKYYQGGTEVQPINAGEYTVKISVTEGTNFNAASGLTDEGWAFTIAAITTEPVVELSGNTTYTYTGKKITPDVTVKIGDKILTAGTDYTITYGDNVNAGPNAGSVTVTAKGNYGFAAVTETFTIEKADPELSFEKSAVTTSYGTNPANNKLTNKGDGAVTYTSSNESVVTKFSDGTPIPCGVGDTTITAKSAETTNYKAGTASYTLTVNKAPVHIVQASVADKVYDGSPKAEVTGVLLADKAGVVIGGLTVGTDYNVIGAFQSENAGEQDAEVRVKLLGNFDARYELTSETYMTKATISARPISIANVTTENRRYKRNDTSVTITSLTFYDSDNTSGITLVNGLDYTVSGKMADANIGADKKVAVTVTLQGDAANNYSLAPNTTTAKVTIDKAAGGALTGDNFQQKFSDLRQKTFTPDYTGLPAGETWTYSISDAQTSGSAKVEAVKIDAAGKITYTLTDGEVGDTVSWTVTISNDNYEDFTKDLVLTLTEKDPQEPLRITGDDTVVYGQKLKLSTVGGSGTGEITYSVDATSTGDATIGADGVLTPVKVGSVVIIATKAGDADYSEITSAPFVIMITPATPTGEPKYTKITTGGKTLADADLTLTGSTLAPAEGTLAWVDEAGDVLPGDTEVEVNKTYKWRFTPTDTNYNTLTGEIVLYHVDAPAISAQPKSVSVTAGEKATFEVTATGTDVTYQWQIDRNDGKGFVDITGATGAAYTTGVTDKDCNGFKYQCVISNAAGSVTTDTVVLTVKEKYTITATAGAHGSISPSGNVEVMEGSSQIFVITAEDGYEIESLTVDGKSVDAVTSYTFENVAAAHTIAVAFKLQYKIIDGADSSWNQDTDGSGSIKIRGNGEFSKFKNVKVDGTIVDPANYNASEGSTIIELKADYLKTLSEGTHTFEIAWTDGTAKTSFTVARNTPGSNDNGDGNKDGSNDKDDSNKDSNNDSGNNNSGGNTAGSGDNTAQTLTGSPNTGDASGLWIALFVASAAGLAVMLVRRKK